MDQDERFQTWLTRVSKRELPPSDNPMAQARTLARELADGASRNFWDFFIEFLRTFQGINGAIVYERKDGFQSNYVNLYLGHRWNHAYPRLEILATKDYINLGDNGIFINKSALDLVDEIEPASIFISYKRTESSAFALLVLTKLKDMGLEAFLDLSLEPGENWHAGLEKRIKEYDYLIAIIGRQTLKSEICIKEIVWAIEAGLNIIPIWHNKFRYKPNKWDIPPEVSQLLAITNAIAVKEESASGYNTAIVELLNRFGVTP